MFKPNHLTETLPKSDPEIVKLGTEARRLMTEAMTRSKLTAAEVAGELSKRLDRPITRSMIYEITRTGAPEREIRLLATWVPAFCEVTGDDRLQRWLAGPRLRELISMGEGIEYIRTTGLELLDIATKLQKLSTRQQGEEETNSEGIAVWTLFRHPELKEAPETPWLTVEQVTHFERISRMEVYRRMQPGDPHFLVSRDREDGQPGKLIDPRSMSFDAQERWRKKLLETADSPKPESVPAQLGLLPRTEVDDQIDALKLPRSATRRDPAPLPHREALPELQLESSGLFL